MLLALLLTLSMAAPGLTGVVKDTSGGAVPGASVTVQTTSGAEQHTVVSGSDGRFTFETVPEGAVLIVRAGGFAEQRQTVGGSTDVEVILQPPSILETVVVTPGRTEQRLGDTPASVNVVTAEQIQSSPAVVPDDVLRSVPSFSLFRRASSVVAQPTTQGVSLRGIGPSGQSRTLVLLDGVPFNDPFGGWVYWTRVPMVSVDRIEVTEDTASGLYGNYAMGGVINIVTSRPSRHTLELKPQYGTFTPSSSGLDNGSTPKFDMFASDIWKKVGFAVEGSAFNTDGFKTVTKEAGPIDNNAAVNYGNITGKVEYLPSDRLGVLRARRLLQRESRQRQGWRTERHEVDEPERRRSNEAAGLQRSAGAALRRHPERALQLPRGQQRRDDAQHGPPGDRSAGPGQWIRRHGPVAEDARHETGADRGRRLALG